MFSKQKYHENMSSECLFSVGSKSSPGNLLDLRGTFSPTILRYFYSPEIRSIQRKSRSCLRSKPPVDSALYEPKPRPKKSTFKNFDFFMTYRYVPVNPLPTIVDRSTIRFQIDLAPCSDIRFQ